jgi:hypothetical protein
MDSSHCLWCFGLFKANDMDNYNDAFAEYIKDKGMLTLAEFKEKVYSYNPELRECLKLQK